MIAGLPRKCQCFLRAVDDERHIFPFDAQELSLHKDLCRAPDLFALQRARERTVCVRSSSRASQSKVRRESGSYSPIMPISVP